MTVILWIIQKISPLVVIFGGLALLSEFTAGDVGIEPYVYIIAGVLALVGFIIGFTNWALDVPPKFFWTKSRVELFDNRVGNAFGYAIIFFLTPFFVEAVKVAVRIVAG